MGVMDKFLNYMKLNDEEDEGFYDDDYLDDEEEVEPVKKFSPAKSRQQAQEDDEPEEKSKRSSQPKVTPIHRTVTKKMPGTGMEVCVIKPTSDELLQVFYKRIDMFSCLCFFLKPVNGHFILKPNHQECEPDHK